MVSVQKGLHAAAKDSLKYFSSYESASGLLQLKTYVILIANPVRSVCVASNNSQ